MKNQKRKRNWIPVLVVVIVLSIYPIYFCVVQIATKSDSLTLFPTSGVWLAQMDDYSIKIDLDGTESITTLILADSSTADEIELTLSESGGHGTILFPSSSTSILHFTSESLELNDENYVSFSCSKFKFNEEDFYLYKIYTSESNKLSVIKNKTTLHFVKQS